MVAAQARVDFAQGLRSLPADTSLNNDIAPRIMECIQVVVKQAKMDPDELVNGMVKAARDSLVRAQKEREKLRASYDSERGGLLLPDSLTMEKVSPHKWMSGLRRLDRHGRKIIMKL